MPRPLLATLIAAFLPILSVRSLQAALPPFYQSVKELDAILHDPGFNGQFTSADYIETIEHVADGWRLTTNKRTVLAKIVHKKSQMPGPLQFDIEWKVIGSENAR